MATEKITLFDSERDILLEINVSPADARRATTDIVFATALLNKALANEPQPSTSAHVETNNSDDVVENLPAEETFIDEGSANVDCESQESEASLYRWTPSCVLLLLESYKSIEKTLHSGKLSQKKVWEKVAVELSKKGHNVTGPQCSSKLRSLKKTYKSIKDHNNKSGNDRRSWQYLELMDEIFAKKAWCQPVAVASSSGLSVRQPESSESMGETDSGCSLKSNKTTLTTLLKKRLRQKEEHEERKMRRHNERMEMDRKLLEVFEKLANK